MRRTRTLWITLFLAIFALTCGACTGTTAGGTGGDITGQVDGDFNGKIQEAEAHWAKRIDRAELEKAIATWEEALNIKSTGSAETRKAAVFNIHVHLSRAYYFLGDAHIRFDSKTPMDPDNETKAALKAVYAKGISNGSLALSIQNSAFKKAVDLERPILQIAGQLQKADVPAMYWWSINLSKWALLDGLASAITEVDNIKAVMDRLKTLEPSFFYHAPYRYFGAYYTKLPMPGGDVKQSSENFDTALAKGSDYLGTHLLYAQFYAYKIDDIEKFRSHLEIVLNADSSKFPDIQPENEIEKKKAKLLLDSIDDLF